MKKIKIIEKEKLEESADNEDRTLEYETKKIRELIKKYSKAMKILGE